MPGIHIRFYAELNDFLPPHRRQVRFYQQLKERTSTKDAIESLGVPHPEIDLILVQGESVDFSFLVQDGDEIRVYPYFRSLDVTPVSRVRPPPLSPARFVVDVHLGKLATELRLLGFDTLYWNDAEDEYLAERSCCDPRILLTQDRALLKRRIVTYGYCVRSRDPWQQLLDVLKRFELFGAIIPFQRCLRCNGWLQPVSKQEIWDRLLPLTQRHYHHFRQCQTCDQIYWQGSHHERMQAFVNRVLQVSRGCGQESD